MILSRKSSLYTFCSLLSPDIFSSNAIFGDLYSVLQQDKLDDSDITIILNYFQSYKSLTNLKSKSLCQLKQFIRDLQCQEVPQGATLFSTDPEFANTFSAQNQHNKHTGTCPTTWFMAWGQLQVTKVQDQKTQQQPQSQEKDDVPQTDQKAPELYNVNIYDTIADYDPKKQKDWKHYEITASARSVVFFISSEKLHRFLINENQTEEYSKLQFLGTLFGVPDSYLPFLKAINKKIVIKSVLKSHKIIEEGAKEDNFVMLRKGNVQLYRQFRIDYKNTPISASQDSTPRLQNPVDTLIYKPKTLNLGIVSEGQFLNDQCFFRTLQITEAAYTAVATTNCELFLLSKSELTKYYADIPELQVQLYKIASIKRLNRQKQIEKSLQSQQQLTLQAEQCSASEIVECSIGSLFKRASSGFRKPKQHSSSFYQQFIGAAKYEQIVKNEEKIFKPLNELSAQRIKENNNKKERQRQRQKQQLMHEDNAENVMSQRSRNQTANSGASKNRGTENHHHQNKSPSLYSFNQIYNNNLRAEEKRLKKEEKLSKILVKKLVTTRVQGINDRNIQIHLKPTLFYEKKLSKKITNENIDDIRHHTEDPETQNPHQVKFYSGAFNDIKQDFIKQRKQKLTGKLSRRASQLKQKREPSIGNDDEKIRVSIQNQDEGQNTVTVRSPTQIRRTDNRKSTPPLGTFSRDWKTSAAENQQYSPLNTVDTGLINELSKTTLDYKQCLLKSKFNSPQQGKLSQPMRSFDVSHKVRILTTCPTHKSVKKGERKGYQVDLNRHMDTVILTQSKTGKVRRIRVHVY